MQTYTCTLAEIIVWLLFILHFINSIKCRSIFFATKKDFLWWCSCCLILFIYIFLIIVYCLILMFWDVTKVKQIVLPNLKLTIGNHTKSNIVTIFNLEDLGARGILVMYAIMSVCLPSILLTPLDLIFLVFCPWNLKLNSFVIKSQYVQNLRNITVTPQKIHRCPFSVWSLLVVQRKFTLHCFYVMIIYKACSC